MVKELALVVSKLEPSTIDRRRLYLRNAVCPRALLDALQSMIAIETLWWHKTPLEEEVLVMQKLSKLQNLEIMETFQEQQEPFCWDGLASLTGLTLLVATFASTTDIMRVLCLTSLEKLDVRGGRASRSLLFRVLTGLPRLKEVFWSAVAIRIWDPDGSVPPTIPDKVAGSLTRLACSPAAGQACDALQSISFPHLQDLQATRAMDGRFRSFEPDHSLAWFPLMCGHAPSLTSLKLLPYFADVSDRVTNVRAGIPLLTNLVSLHLVLRTGIPLQRRLNFVGALHLTGLTCLTRLWVEGVVDTRSFDTEVVALSRLKALRELLLFEDKYVLAEKHIPGPEDAHITREAVARLCAALPRLKRFAVMGAWVDLGRRSWTGSRVTSEGRIVLQSEPYELIGSDAEDPAEDAEDPEEEDEEEEELEQMKHDFDDVGTYSHDASDVYFIKDVLKLRQYRLC